MQAEPLVTTPASPPRLMRFLLLPLSVLGATLAGYLLVLWLSDRGLPIGCGHGSGCDEVLSSRWSQVFGVPVSLPALIIYGVLMGTVLGLGFTTSGRQKVRAWAVLVLLSTVLAGSAIWFVGLQAVLLKAFCPWCLAEHGLGILIGAIVLWSVPGYRNSFLAAGAIGFASVGALALAQTLVEFHPPAVQRLPARQNADTGPGADRQISMLDGQLTLAPHELPALGSPDSPKLVVVLFDYCCPHCRATHGYLLNALTAHKNELAVLLLPTPLNTKCNPYWEETEPRFANACELARLAIAVWRADGAAFPQFDAWLFEPEMPRDPAEARRKAEELVPAAALAQALKDPWIDRQIEQNVAAYHNSGAARVPVILSPGMRAIVGRPESEAQLFQLLEKELSLRTTPSSKPQ